MESIEEKHQFASDNTAAMCPEVVAALQAVNTGAVPSYGDDVWTARLRDRVREIFERDCDVHLVFNGTAANALALAQLSDSFHSIICHESAHIHTDEGGAPEFFTKGSKLIAIGGANGKLDLAQAEAAIVFAQQRGVHAHKPQVISITQSTEVGTVYTTKEVATIAEFARQKNMLVHMDGARFSNAVASLGCAPKAITGEANVDVLCFGGTKNGLAAGEMVVFFNLELSREFAYRVKQGGQLGSKLRFFAAPWLALLTDEVWLRNARHANSAASKLARLLGEVAKLEVVFPVEANAVFVRMHDELVRDLNQRGWRFYKIIEPDVYRLMCAWSVTEQDIEHFVSDVKLGAHK
jgi:threonine aldolase